MTLSSVRSLVSMSRADRLRKYVRRFMSHRVELARFAGLAIAWIAAWQHWSIVMAIGAPWIAVCWPFGLLPVGAVSV